MKRKLVTLLCVLLCGSAAFADQKVIDLQMQRDDKKPQNPAFPISLLHPVVYQDGHTLTFPSFLSECIVSIVQGESIYTFEVIPGVSKYEVPDYVTGECVIEVIWGDDCYIGYTIF